MKRSHILILLFVFGLGIFFRTYRLTTVPVGLYPDEAMDGNDAGHANLTGDYQAFYPEDTGREGVFINAQAMALKLSGIRAPWVLRSVAAVFGSLTILGLYFLIAELFNSVVGLWASFFMATGFWHIVFSRIAFRAIMAPFCLVWAIYFLLVGYRCIRNAASTSGRIICPALGGLFFGLGFHTYIAYRVMPALIIFIMLYFWAVARSEGWMSGFFFGSLSFLCAAFLAALPLLLYFARTPGMFSERMSAVSIFKHTNFAFLIFANFIKTAFMFTFFGDLNWRHNYAGRPVLSGMVGALFVVGIVLSLRPLDHLWKNLSHYRQWKVSFASEGTQLTAGFAYAVVWIWFTLGAIPAVLSDEAPHSLRSLLMAPMAYTFAAVAAAFIYQHLRPHVRLSTLNLGVLLLALVLMGESYNLYFRMWATSPNVYIAFTGDYVDVARQINSLPESTPKYVIFPAGRYDFNLLDGIPLPAQTVMFMTETFETRQREQKNVHYFIEGQEGEIPENAKVFYMRAPI